MVVYLVFVFDADGKPIDALIHYELDDAESTVEYASGVCEKEDLPNSFRIYTIEVEV